MRSLNARRPRSWRSPDTVAAVRSKPTICTLITVWRRARCVSVRSMNREQILPTVFPTGSRYSHHNWRKTLRYQLAGEPGFEPGPTESESVVLPLNYSPSPDAGGVRRAAPLRSCRYIASALRVAKTNDRRRLAVLAQDVSSRHLPIDRCLLSLRQRKQAGAALMPCARVRRAKHEQGRGCGPSPIWVRPGGCR